MGTVETIAGGFAGGGASNKAKKRHLKAVMNAENKRCKEQYEPICFKEEDFREIEREHDDSMVISALIHNFLVKRVLVDQCSFADILYSHAVETLGISKNSYNRCNGVLVSFTGGHVQVESTMRLQVTVGNHPQLKTMEVDFLIVSTHNNVYNAILG